MAIGRPPSVLRELSPWKVAFHLCQVSVAGRGSLSSRRRAPIEYVKQIDMCIYVYVYIHTHTCIYVYISLSLSLSLNKHKHVVDGKRQVGWEKRS